MNDILGGIINDNPWWSKAGSVWFAEELLRRGVRLSTCDCGESLSPGKCRYCDNDE